MTGDLSSGPGTVAAFNCGTDVHFQSGVVRASISWDPSAKAVEPKSRRRDILI
jgi:hypothetical protein